MARKMFTQRLNEEMVVKWGNSMLIRYNRKDLSAWYALATEVSEIFQHPGTWDRPDFTSYAQSKVSKYKP